MATGQSAYVGNRYPFRLQLEIPIPRKLLLQVDATTSVGSAFCDHRLHSHILQYGCTLTIGDRRAQVDDSLMTAKLGAHHNPNPVDPWSGYSCDLCRTRKATHMKSIDIWQTVSVCDKCDRPTPVEDHLADHAIMQAALPSPGIQELQ